MKITVTNFLLEKMEEEFGVKITYKEFRNFYSQKVKPTTDLKKLSKAVAEQKIFDEMVKRGFKF